MKAIVTRRARGEFCLLTKYPPVIIECGKSGRKEPYAQPGDPLNTMVCYDIVQHGGIELKPLQSQDVTIPFKAVGDPYECV